MYIGFAHFWFPIIFGILSYFSNSIFIFIVSTKSRPSFGVYKYMLISFGVFDMMYSTVDMLVAMGSHSEGNTFCVFVSHGPFSEDLEIGFFALCIRCMFFSLSYGVLELHFIYRYVALCKPTWIHHFSEPKRIFVMFLGVLAQGLLWFAAVYFLLYADAEMRSYMEIPFRRDYHADIQKLPLLGSTYWGASSSLILRSSVGIIIVTLIACWTIFFCCWTGWTINSKLSTTDMSSKTKKMHRNLLTALAIQTFIPFVISYIPCVFAWSAPVVRIDTKSLNNNTSIIAVAAFPFIDPLAIMLLIPDYRIEFCRLFCPCLPKSVRTHPENTIGDSLSKT